MIAECIHYADTDQSRARSIMTCNTEWHGGSSTVIGDSFFKGFQSDKPGVSTVHEQNRYKQRSEIFLKQGTRKETSLHQEKIVRTPQKEKIVRKQQSYCLLEPWQQKRFLDASIYPLLAKMVTPWRYWFPNLNRSKRGRFKTQEKKT
jgi:hypothetical protein